MSVYGVMSDVKDTRRYNCYERIGGMLLYLLVIIAAGGVVWEINKWL